MRVAHSAVQQRVLEVDADDAPAGQALRPSAWVSTPSPQPMSSSERGRGALRSSSSSVRSKRAIRRRTTGLVEPYLS